MTSAILVQCSTNNRAMMSHRLEQGNLLGSFVPAEFLLKPPELLKDVRAKFFQH